MHGQWVVNGMLAQTHIAPEMPQTTFP